MKRAQLVWQIFMVITYLGKLEHRNTMIMRIKILIHLYHFSRYQKNYIVLVMLDDPKIARDLTYNYRA